jgi:hypothetical protein
MSTVPSTANKLRHSFFAPGPSLNEQDVNSMRSLFADVDAICIGVE